MEYRSVGDAAEGQSLVPKGQQDSAQGLNQVLNLGTSALKPNRPEGAADFPLTVVLIISMNVYAHTNPLLRPFRARCLLGCVPQG
jgi:hypothetical protein